MSHELEVIDGNASVFSVKEPMWHGLGQILTEAPTIKRAVEIARAGYTVATKPLYTAHHDGDGAVTSIDERVTHRATYRTDTNKILGVVGPGYRVTQNADALEAAMGPFVEAGVVSLETGGVLRDGARCWFQAKVNTPGAEILDDDVVEAYVLLLLSHDGIMANRWGFTPQRVVCHNTLSAAIGDKKSQLIKIFHRGNVLATIASIRDVMDLAAKEFQASVEQYKELTKIPCSTEDLKRYVRRVFTPAKDEEDADAAKRIIPQIERLFEDGRGSEIRGVRGTAWGAYNAANEWLGYERGKSQERRLDALWFGHGAALNRRAMQEAFQIAA